MFCPNLVHRNVRPRTATAAAAAPGTAAHRSPLVPFDSVADCPPDVRPPLIIPDTSLYAGQLADKADKVRRIFAPLSPPTLEVLASPPLHYRMRCELRVWHTGDVLDYIMFSLNSSEDFLAGGLEHEGADEKNPHPNPHRDEGEGADGVTAAAGPTAGPGTPDTGLTKRERRKRSKARAAPPKAMFKANHFPVLTELGNALLSFARDACLSDAYPEIRRRLYQVNVHTTLAGEAAITFVYHNKLGDEWTAEATKLRWERGGNGGREGGGWRSQGEER